MYIDLEKSYVEIVLFMKILIVVSVGYSKKLVICLLIVSYGMGKIFCVEFL